MRIERVEPIFVDKFLFVEITTDNGDRWTSADGKTWTQR